MQVNEVWSDLMIRYAIDERDSNQLWQEIEGAYEAENRHYHNLSHVAKMLELATCYQADLRDPDIVFFSIFYHDLVDRVLAKDNELKSAEVAKRRLQHIRMSPTSVHQCVDQIRATQFHAPNQDGDTRYFLDFDLSILGATPEEYEQYAAQVRKEYAVYPSFLYNKGRKKALGKFLDRTRIFQTDTFYASFEAQARENISKELQRL